jgi:hypothetical protein
MAGRVYTVQFNGVAVTAQQDLFEINCASTKIVELMEFHLSQSTEVGDAQEEGLSILLKSGATTSGSGGTAPTAVPNELGDTAFAGTVEVNNTTKANTGTIVTHGVWNWNVRVGLDVYFTAGCAQDTSAVWPHDHRAGDHAGRQHHDERLRRLPRNRLTAAPKGGRP